MRWSPVYLSLENHGCTIIPVLIVMIDILHISYKFIMKWISEGFTID